MRLIIALIVIVGAASGCSYTYHYRTEYLPPASQPTAKAEPSNVNVKVEAPRVDVKVDPAIVHVKVEAPAAATQPTVKTVTPEVRTEIKIGPGIKVMPTPATCPVVPKPLDMKPVKPEPTAKPPEVKPPVRSTPTSRPTPPAPDVKPVPPSAVVETPDYEFRVVRMKQ